MVKVLKVVKNVVFASAVIFFLSFITVCFFSIYEKPILKADSAIILGAAINTPALYNRSLEGLRLYEAGKTEVLVLSGGRISDKDISEAGYMKKVILKNSDPSTSSGSKIIQRIILEENSHTTFENIENSKKLIPNAKSVIIVSDKYHLARGVLIAKRLGFSSVYWSAPDSGYYPKEELYYHYFRESIALLAYIPKFLFK